MNLIMFVVGSTIFILYIVGLLYVINKGHKEQEQDLLNDPEIPKNFKDSFCKNK
jgi:hypothetical protein|tara:strand:- start:148 stop:309 length:162 start_codon:yes stop_codon:yes gene_type:complete